METTVLAELRNRISPTLFAERDLEDRELVALVEAARWGPSCSNNQPWNYIFVHKKDPTRTTLEDALTLGNAWAKKAPYLVAVGADPDKDCKNNDLPYYAYDAGLSVMCLVIEAEHLGLRVHQMAGWDEQKVKRALRCPQTFRVIVVFALGYGVNVQSAWDTLDERTRNKVSKPRQRRPPSENFFSSEYGNSLPSII